MSKKQADTTILAIFPNTKGFGYAVMENALTANDYGIVTVNPISNEKIIKRIQDFLDYVKPKAVIVEDYKGLQSRKSKRVEKLIDKITGEATKRNITVSSYPREQIRFVFRQFGAYSKYEISKTIAEHIAHLKVHLRPKRLYYQAEPYTMGIFDAISLGITHFYNTD